MKHITNVFKNNRMERKPLKQSYIKLLRVVAMFMVIAYINFYPQLMAGKIYMTIIYIVITITVFRHLIYGGEPPEKRRGPVLDAVWELIYYVSVILVNLFFYYLQGFAWLNYLAAAVLFAAAIAGLCKNRHRWENLVFLILSLVTVVIWSKFPELPYLFSAWEAGM